MVLEAGQGKPRAPTSTLGPHKGLEDFPCFANIGMSSTCTWQTFLRPVAELGFLRVDGVCKALTSVMYLLIGPVWGKGC